MSETTEKTEKRKLPFPTSLSGLGLSEETIELIYKLNPVFAVLASLVLGAVLFTISGISPLLAYRDLFLGAFGTPRRFSETLVKFTPLLLGGLGTLIAFRTSCFNVGGYGQIYIGALGGVVVAYLAAQVIPFWPVNILLGASAGFIAGGLLAFIPAIMKTELSTSEVVTSVMLNYIAVYVAWFLISETGPFHVPEDYLPVSWPLPENAKYPQFFGRLHVGFLFAVIAIPLVWLLFHKLTLGYEMRATGLTGDYLALQVQEKSWLFTGGFHLNMFRLKDGLRFR